MHGDGSEAKAYTLSDLAGKREGLGFSQPVASDRCTPVELMPLAQISEDQRTRISVDYNGTYHDGSVTAQAMDGKVYVRFDDREEVQCLDLATAKYRWI